MIRYIIANAYWGVPATAAVIMMVVVLEVFA